jgi:pSer/pThr/pTyr-binding forkhead associated (FHA) protein
MAIHFEITPPGQTGRTFSISLDMDKILLGRGAPSDINLPSAAVSYHHATIEMIGTTYALMDAGSKNGTFLGGKKILPGKRYHLSSSDSIRICGFDIRINLSVPLAEPYSAEKTDVLARDMLMLGMAGRSDSGAWVEVTSGTGAGKTFRVPPSARLFTVGTSEGCDLPIVEKRAGELRIEIELAPAGWRINENSFRAAAHLVSFPAKGRLRDGDEIEIGKTRILFHDDIDRALAGLKTRRDLEEAEAPPSPEQVQPQQPGEEKPQESAGRGKTGKAGSAADGPAPQTEKYAMEYRIAAIAFGIIAFLVSLLILILLLF